MDSQQTTESHQRTAGKVLRAVKIPMLVSLLLVVIFFLLLLSAVAPGQDAFIGGLSCCLFGVPIFMSLLLAISVYSGMDIMLNRGGSMKEVLYAGLALASVVYVPSLILLGLFILNITLWALGLFYPAIFREMRGFDMNMLFWLGVLLIPIAFLMVCFTVAGGYLTHRKHRRG